MSSVQYLEKRLFDIVASLIGIVVLFLPGVLVAILVKVTSRGPAFYRQRRVGKHGNLFTCVKFRTMRLGSEQQGSITAANDNRITAVGRILRRFKIDELPQLANVLIGKMSFVGPRPDVPGYADRLTGSDRKMLDLNPGITGPASLCFRNEEDILARVPNAKSYNDAVIWPRKVAINLDYIDHWSFFKDLGYILVTVVPALDKVFRIVPNPAPGRPTET